VVIEDTSSILQKINPYQFKWKESGVKSYGVIAQELEKILPELINNTDGKKYVNYTPLIAFLIAEVKQLRVELDRMKGS
jgi:hypothetical protein